MAFVDDVTKTAEKRWGCTYLPSPYKGVLPGGPGANRTDLAVSTGLE